MKYLLVAIAMLTFNPFFIWGHGIIFYALCAVLLLWASVRMLFRDRFRPEFIALAASLLIMVLFYTGHAGLVPGFFGASFLIFLVVMLYNDKSLLLDTFYTFRNVFAALVLISLPVYLYVTLGGAPLGQLVPPTEIKQDMGLMYDWYGVLVVINNQYLPIFGMQFHRLHLIFDEPGWVGTLAAMLWYSSRFAGIHDKKNGLFLVAGFLSLSAAFFILLLFAYLLLMFSARAKLRYLLLMLVAGLGIVMSDILPQDSPLVARFTGGSSGSFDNRSSNILRNEFSTLCPRSLEDCFLGKGANYASNLDGGIGSSVLYDIIDYGFSILIIVFSFFWLYYLALFKPQVIQKTWYVFASLTILFALNLYQRPFYFTILTYIVLFAPIIKLELDLKLRQIGPPRPEELARRRAEAHEGSKAV